MKNSIILILLSSLIASNSFAASTRLNFGLSNINSKLENSNMKINQSAEITPTVGISYFSNDTILSFNTDRLFSQKKEGVALQKDNNRAYRTLTKSKTDSVSFGKFINKNCVLSVFVAKNNSSTDFYLGNTKKFINTETSYLTGLNASYFMNKDASLNILYAHPVKSKTIRKAYGVSINYYF